MSTYPILTQEQFKDAIKDISQYELEAKKAQQLAFIFKLIDTNNELHRELSTDGNDESLSPDDVKLYKETIDENKESLLNQIERIHLINIELVRRGILNESKASAEEKKLHDDVKKRTEPNESANETEGVVL